MLTQVVSNQGLCRLLGVFSLGAAIIQPAQGQTEHAKEAIPAIIKRITERQSKVLSARVELTVSELIHQGSFEASLKNASKTKRDSGTLPSKDNSYQTKQSIVLSGQRLRFAYSRPVLDADVNQLYWSSVDDRFDGNVSRVLHTPVSATKDYPSATVKPMKRSESATTVNIMPLIFCLRGYDKHFFQDLESYEVLPKEASVSGRPCVEFTRESRSMNRRESLYLDKGRDYVLVRYSILDNEKVSWSVDAEYAPDATVGWFPKNWEYIIQRRADGTPSESGRCAVASYEINGPVESAEFTFDWPPNTYVWDITSGREMRYVIQPSGAKGPEVFSPKGATYEQVKDAKSSSMAQWFLLLASGAFVLCLTGWIWVRRSSVART